MTRLKFSPALLLLLGWLLCSCGAEDTDKPSQPLSTEATREVAMHVLLNRYPEAQIVSELEQGTTWKYRFATNGVTLPVAVVVDRKIGKAHFENVNP